MKITVNNLPPEKEKQTFPAIYEYCYGDNHGFLVMFVAREKGIVIARGDSMRNVGEFVGDFSACDGLKYWIPRPDLSVTFGGN